MEKEIKSSAIEPIGNKEGRKEICGRRLSIN